MSNSPAIPGLPLRGISTAFCMPHCIDGAEFLRERMKPCMQAANSATTSYVERQLQRDPGAARVRSRFHKNTLLHEACIHWSGHPDQQFLIGVLIKNGVDVNATNSRGETALDTAVKKLGSGDGKNMQGRAVEQLLQHHANVTPGVLRRSEELARRGDPWLREAIVEQHPLTTRL